MFKLTISILLSIVLSNSVSSQESDLNFLNIGSREGLSSNIVNAIIKDKHGYMWFATDDGLNKFDGSKFTVYRHSPGDSKSIPSNEVLELYEDEFGQLWIATAAGVMLYNRKTDSFERMTLHGVTSICSDKKGSLWIASFGGITLLNLKTRKISYLAPPKAQDQEIVTQPVQLVYRDSKGQMWLGTGHGLYRYVSAQNSFVRFSHSDSIPGSLADNLIRTICEDNSGRLWVGTNNGLSMLRPDQKSFENYYHNAADKNTLSGNILYTLASGPDGKLWIGSEDGLTIFNPKSNKFIRVESNVRERYSMVGKAVKSIFIDDNEISWVATFRGGVNKYDKNLPFFHLKQSNPLDPFGLKAGVVTSFAAIDGKGIYVGTDGGGLSLFDIKNGLFYPTPLSKTSANGGLAILAMDVKSSEVWIGTFLKGLYIFDTRTGAVKMVTKGPEGAGLSGQDVFCIKKDSRGNMWLGTNGQGVNYYNAAEKKFKHFQESGKQEAILHKGYIRAIEEDQEGKIWIASTGLGIAVYNPLTNKSITYNLHNSGLPINNILSLCAARNGTIWVGTAGEGLAYFDRSRFKFVSFTEKDGLANGVIYRILEDDLGKIWVSTNNGLSSFDPASRKFRNYSYHNGLQRSTFVQGAGLRLDDGRLLFGGIEGFNYFHPRQLLTNKNVPRVVLTDLKISNKSVQPAGESELTEHISVAKEINLDYKENFSLSFSALNYSSPQENRYLYKLEKFDKDWNHIGTGTTAVYTNLDPGTYVFKVKARSDGGEWVTPETSIIIRVRPPFWRTYYAYAFYLLVVASLLWYVRYRGIKKIEARFKLQEERLQVQQVIEQERREAEHLREFDQLKIKFLTNLGHEFRTPISLIVGPVDQLLQEETNTSKSGKLGMIRRNARRLLNLVNQLLDFRTLEEKELKLNAKEGNFIDFVRDIGESFRDLSERKQINFVFDTSVKYYFTHFDHDKIERVFFNLLSNAFKFTLKGGEVILRVERDLPDSLKVTVSDTGIGMAPEIKDRIFDRFFQIEGDNAVLNQGSGIGLSITLEFVKLHGGTIEVDSIPGKGSTFTLRFPFPILGDNDDDIELLNINDEQDFIEDEIKSVITEEQNSSIQLPVLLIVEDNDDFRYYLKDSLKSFYKVVEASNGKEGWQKALSSHPQVVVSDISMPYSSGIELCKKIKSDKRTSHIPVLLLTALTGEEEQLLGLETGANDYLVKPFNLSILNIKIRNLLNLNEQVRNTYSKQVKVQVQEVQVVSDNEKLLSRVVQYIESNLSNPILSVEDLSKKVGMSRGTLYSKILEVTGESPSEFIRSVKLDRAAILLEKSDMNIAQVCYSAGFSSPNYFTRAFKARFNMLPSEYITLKRVEKSAAR